MAPRFGIGSCIALLIATMLSAACGRLPSVDRHAGSVRSTPLLRSSLEPSARWLRRTPLSGVYPLFDARDAFAARVMLTQTAERTLDIRYYVWKRDLSGAWLLEALRAAADRGVHVRLLLDDNHTSELDPLLAALDAHPNV